MSEYNKDEALRLANCLENPPDTWMYAENVQQAADELRRLHEVNTKLQDELTTVSNEADALEEFLSAASRHEKEASAIINSLTADIYITVPLRDYSEMSPKDCYELGMMDSVAALKAQIYTAVDAAFAAGKKDE
jgi:hypothetical protein